MNLRFKSALVLTAVSVAGLLPAYPDVVTFNLQGTLDNITVHDPPPFPLITPADVGAPASGTFSFDPDDNDAFFLYGIPSIQINGQTFDMAHYFGTHLNTTFFRLENDADAGFLGTVDRFIVDFDSLPTIGGDGIGSFHIDLELIDLDASVFSAPNPFPSPAEASDILSNANLTDYEIIRWTFNLSDALPNDPFDLTASGDVISIIPEPSTCMFGLLGSCILVFRRRRSGRFGSQ